MSPGLNGEIPNFKIIIDSKFHNFEDLLRSLVNIKPSLTTLALAFHDLEAKNGTPVGGKRMLPGQFRWFEVSLFHHPRVPLLTAASTFLYQHIGLSLPNISSGHTPEFEVIFCSTSISMDIYHCLGLSVVISKYLWTHWDVSFRPNTWTKVQGSSRFYLPGKLKITACQGQKNWACLNFKPQHGRN